MLSVRSKLDAQRAERILGLFLTVVLGDDGSIGGRAAACGFLDGAKRTRRRHYLRVQRPPKSKALRAQLPFRKVMAHSVRSRDQWHL